MLDALRGRRRAIVSAVMGAGKSVLMAEVARLALPKTVARGQAVVVVAPRTRLVKQLAATFRHWFAQHGLEGEFVGEVREGFDGWEAPVVIATSASFTKALEALAAQDRQVSLLIVDECHMSEGAGLKAAIQTAGAVCQVGFTATPMRSVSGERLELWDEVAFRYSMDDGLREGVLVPMRVVGLDGVTNRPVDEACLDMILRHGEGPGIVSASSIDDANEYSEWLKENGVAAESIHSLLPEKTQEYLLATLRAGALRCLVHVSLLAEGVDFPWLRWICLRRPVRANVRFLQELGRPMRSDPGKTECVVMDPHLLLGRFGVRPAEAIGVALEVAAAEDELERSRSERKPGEPEEREAIAIDGLIGHLRLVESHLRRTGVLTKPPFQGAGLGWEVAQVTGKQVEALKKARKYTRHVPEKHREALKALLRVPWALTRGEASLLLDAMFAGAGWARTEGARRGLQDRVVWNLQWDEMSESVDEESVKLALKAGRRMEREIDTR